MNEPSISTLEMRKIEMRKVQLSGRSYTISLPKSWANQLNLKPGDSLAIQVQPDSSLLILPTPPSEPGSQSKQIQLSVHPDQNPHAIARKVISHYLAGYNLIKLVADKDRIPPSQREALRQLIRNKLAGVEIISDLPHEIVLQVLLSYPVLSVKEALKRMGLLASSMLQDCIQALREMNLKLAQDVILRDDDLDRIELYVIKLLKSAVDNPRLIRELGLESPRNCLGYRLIVKSVERVGDHASAISQNILQLKSRPKSMLLQQIESIGSLAISMFQNSMNSLFNVDPDMAEHVIQSVDRILQMEERMIEILVERSPPNQLIPLRMIMESLRRVAEYSCDISETVLNMAAR